jgi:hypothetical protein
MYSEDDNYIHLEALKSRTEEEYIAAFKRAHALYQTCNISIKMQILDNETSNKLHAYLSTHGTIQYVPPGNHRSNKAERMIQTVKDHFISILATTNPEYPLSAWDQLLEHTELTLNLLRASGTDPTLSAWHQVRGPYHFLVTPIAPPGTKAVVHDKPHIRATWAPHGTIGYYTGPALNHYRCFTFLMAETHASRITDTVAWHPTNVELPGSSRIDELTATLQHLTTILTSFRTNTASSTSDTAVLPHLPLLFKELDSLKALYTPPGLSPITRSEQRVPATPVIPPPTTQPVEQRVPNEVVPTPPAVPTNDTLLQPYPTTRSGRIYAQSTVAPSVVLPTSQADTECWLFANTAAHMDEHGTVQTYRSVMNTVGPEQMFWKTADLEEWVRLLETTETMHFCHWKDRPRHKKVAYYNPQIKKKVKNTIPKYRVRGTIGGDALPANGEVRANVASLQTFNILLNTTVSTPDAEMLHADIDDFYLGTPYTDDNGHPDEEFMIVLLTQIPQPILAKYDVINRYAFQEKVMVRVVKGMYGLKRAGILAQQQLVKHLAEADYIQDDATPCLFKHKTKPVSFCIVVDDFAIQYIGKDNANHLLDKIKEKYTIKEDWEASKYIGITCNFATESSGRKRRYVTKSMPGYYDKALQRFGVVKGKHKVNSPIIYTPPIYGSQRQQQVQRDQSPSLDDAGKKRIQEIVGCLLFPARCVDSIILHAVTRLGQEQANPTQATMTKAKRLLQYIAWHPNPSVTYYASDMRLLIHSDASYLCEINAQSRAAGIHYLGNTGEEGITALPNGAIHVFSSVIDGVPASVAEAEYISAFLNGQIGVSIQNTLAFLGFPQEATPITCDNKCAVGLANNTVKQDRSKAIDMKYHWIRHKTKEKTFTLRWQKGKQNLADFFTKAHPAHHVRELTPLYMNTPTAFTTLAPQLGSNPFSILVTTATDVDNC